MIRITETEKLLINRVSDWVGNGRLRSEGLRRIQQDGLSCPSASNSHGEFVFAVFDESGGKLRYLPKEIRVPNVAKSQLDMDAFALKNRLEGKCATSSCHYWQGACQLGYFVSEVEVRGQVQTQECAIRDRCRWLKENGPEICGACASVRNLPVQSVSIKSRQ